MGTILPKVSSNLSKMWNRILNLEQSLFPALKEELRLEELSYKEQKLISILDFAQIEKNITVVSITNTPKDREEIARAFIAKSVYNIQTTREADQADLYYYRARYYDPTTQRFLSKDPIEFESGDFNFYRYVGNDCVNFVDPSGLNGIGDAIESITGELKPIKEMIKESKEKKCDIDDDIMCHIDKINFDNELIKKYAKDKVVSMIPFSDYIPKSWLNAPKSNTPKTIDKNTTKPDYTSLENNDTEPTSICKDWFPSIEGNETNSGIRADEKKWSDCLRSEG